MVNGSLWRKSKDWLARNQNKVSRGASTIKNQPSVFV
jgi:hypothetical protein